MLETNGRLVFPGSALILRPRVLEVVSASQGADLLQKACNTLRFRQNVASVPAPNANALWVLSGRKIESQALEGDNWRIELRDTDRIETLNFAVPEHRSVLAQLVERCVLVAVKQRTKLWTLESPRIWYAHEPFLVARGIRAFRRYEVSAIPVDSEGVAVTVDISTAFLSEHPVSFFFDDTLPEEEASRRRREFDFLTQRQSEQKGTLLYVMGESHSKCYFDEFVSGMTCATTGSIRVKGKTYPSLAAYNKERHGAELAGDDEPVARVSFQGLDKTQYVSAVRLFPRIFNNVLPPELKNADKIPPHERAALIEGFWLQTGEGLPGAPGARVQPQFWRPSAAHDIPIRPPDLIFGGGRILRAPASPDVREYEEYFRVRKRMLKSAGCLSVSPTLDRTLYVCVPNRVPEQMAQKLADDLVDCLSSWTNVPIKPYLVRYPTLEKAFEELNRGGRRGNVVFVFEDDDPATYYTVSYELKGWRVKRITFDRLEEHRSKMERASASGNGLAFKAERGWRSFVEMCALDVLQSMDCIPWAPRAPLHYESQVTIDVGEDRRHFTLSLVVCRTRPNEPQLRFETATHIKPDPKHETINETALRTAIIELFRNLAERRRFDPLESILFLRDGREGGRECEAIRGAVEELVDEGLIVKMAKVDVVDFHKGSQKGVRLWERHDDDSIGHTLEGRGVLLDPRTVVLVNTGAATLTQGTAEPLMLVAVTEGVPMDHVAEDIHWLAQLNWSSPGVAQRLPINLKRGDEDLKERAAQSIRGIR